VAGADPQLAVRVADGGARNGVAATLRRVGGARHGALPVMQQVRDETRRRKADLIVLATAEATGVLTGAAADTNAILQLTC